MKILICNVGSTSLKYQLFDLDCGENVLSSGGVERVGAPVGRFYAKNRLTGEEHSEEAVFPTHREAIERMLRALLDSVLPELSALDCVGFKVVHARGVTGVQYLTEDVLAKMAAFNAVAPAHNPPYIAAIRQFRSLLPDTPLIGAFETAFHADMPPEAALYSIPIELSRKYDVRRYGFHGASHEYLSQWAADAMDRTDLRLVTCHLGGSGSLCAVKNGKSIDTTMGLSLQCGVMHNNRCGDIDPYILFYLAEETGMSLRNCVSCWKRRAAFTACPAAFQTICATLRPQLTPETTTRPTPSSPMPTASRNTSALTRPPWAGWTPLSLPAASVRTAPPSARFRWPDWNFSASASTARKTAMPSPAATFPSTIPPSASSSSRPTRS